MNNNPDNDYLTRRRRLMIEHILIVLWHKIPALCELASPVGGTEPTVCYRFKNLSILTGCHDDISFKTNKKQLHDKMMSLQTKYNMWADRYQNEE